MSTLADLHRFYDGPVPNERSRAASCGGFVKLAEFCSLSASRHRDREALLVLTTRRARVGSDREAERALRSVRARGMAHLRYAQATNCLPLLPPTPPG